MKITKATFDCIIAMPGYANVKPGSSEIILEPGEEIEDAWSELNRRAQAWHRKEYPHLYQEEKGWTPGSDFPQHMKTEVTYGPLPIISKDKEPEERTIGIAIADIYSCESLKVLETYRLMAKSKPELQAAYTQQFAKLSKVESK